MKKIKETKCTCQACGEVWYYGKEEALENFGERMQNLGSQMGNVGSDLMCCTGCLPAAFLPRHQVKDVQDLNRCPKCQSKAVKKEVVVHEVD